MKVFDVFIYMLIFCNIYPGNIKIIKISKVFCRITGAAIFCIKNFHIPESVFSNHSCVYAEMKNVSRGA